MKKLFYGLLIISLVIFSVNAWSATFYVTDSKELQEALDDAGGNGENDHICIYVGTYEGNFVYQEPAQDADKITRLIGGYNDEGKPINDPSKTILDGQQEGRTLECNIQGSLQIMNLTIQNGRSELCGGGLGIAIGSYAKKPGVVFLMNNIIQNNHSEDYAGGLYLQSRDEEREAGNIFLINNVISGNTASGRSAEWGGGGAFIESITLGDNHEKPGEIWLFGNTIKNNGCFHGWGGGVSILTRSDTCPAGLVYLDSNTISDNTNRGEAAGISISSKSRSETGTSAPITLKKNTITGMNPCILNDPSSDATFAGGDGAHIRTSSESGGAAKVILNNNTIAENSGRRGGIHIFSKTNTGYSGDIIVSGNTVSRNSAIGVGNEFDHVFPGGISAITGSFSVGGKSGNIVFTNNMITDNNSVNYGGGAYINSASLSLAGDIIFTNNTVTGNNTTMVGGGIYLMGGNNTIDVYNNIIWGNMATQGGGDIFLWCSAIFNGFNNNYSDLSGSWDSEGGNIDQDPRFVGGGDYHINFFSPCRNAGTASAPGLPQFDYDGQNRKIAGIPDIGADEVSFVMPKNLRKFIRKFVPREFVDLI